MYLQNLQSMVSSSGPCKADQNNGKIVFFGQFSSCATNSATFCATKSEIAKKLESVAAHV